MFLSEVVSTRSAFEHTHRFCQYLFLKLWSAVIFNGGMPVLCYLGSTLGLLMEMAVSRGIGTNVKQDRAHLIPDTFVFLPASNVEVYCIFPMSPKKINFHIKSHCRWLARLSTQADSKGRK